MMKNTLYFGLLLSIVSVTWSCTEEENIETLAIDDEEELKEELPNSVADTITIPEIPTNIEAFYGSWEVQLYESSFCEMSTGECSYISESKGEYPLYTKFHFDTTQVSAWSLDNSIEIFSIIYTSVDELEFMNEATASNQWDGTHQITWTDANNLVTSNTFYSTDSTFEFNDTFYLKRL